MCMGPTILNLKSAYGKVGLGLPFLIEWVKMLAFNSLTSLSVCGNLSIKKSWVTLC